MNNKNSNKCKLIAVYQSIIILAESFILAGFPSLLIWKFKIMSLSDSNVLFELTCCYILACILAVIAIRFLVLAQKRRI